MKYFYDCEFFEDGTTIDLISIGVVAEDGRELYACSTDAHLHRVSPWVREHVLPRLPNYGDKAWMKREQIRDELLRFTGATPTHMVRSSLDLQGSPDPDVQLFAYYADYDHVCLCQLFGTMMNLPKHFPMYTRDLKQLSVDVGSPKHPPQANGEHNALEDARWNRDLYGFLMASKGGR
jgi:hypothetical protein